MRPQAGNAKGSCALTALADDVALAHHDLAHGSGLVRLDLVLHLHRLEHTDHLAALHLLPRLDQHLEDLALDRPDDGDGTVRSCDLGRAAAQRRHAVQSPSRALGVVWNGDAFRVS